MSSGVAEPPRTETAEQPLLDQAATILERLFGCPFFFCGRDAHTPDVLTPINCGIADSAYDSPDWLSGVARDDRNVAVHPISELLQALVIPVPRGNRAELIAVGVFASCRLVASDQTALAEQLAPPFRAESVRFCDPELLLHLGQGAQAAIVDSQRLHSRDAELRQLASQLTRNYEEITLLHQLAREAQLSHGARAFHELTVSLLSELIGTSQVVFVECNTGAVSSHGIAILPPHQCAELVKALAERAKRGVLVENCVNRHAWARKFGQIGRLIAVPVADRSEQFGWLLTIGRPEDPELGSVEASLMSAVGAILATFHTNIQLYSNIKDLFLGVVRALSSAIDAKDPYTCGHSERVARLARRLGQELGLADDDCNRIYLSGLLHDVGKIGVRDAVLLKPGRLEPDEQTHMQQHPKIGYEILSGVRQLRPLLAGVRNHHENFDGTGYPDNLTGDQIPLMARILAVADSYDAMSSNRPYRKRLADAEIERIFHEGMDRQWDRTVVNSLLAIRDELIQKSAGPAAQSSDESSQNRGGPRLRQPLDLSKVSKLISLGSP